MLPQALPAKSLESPEFYSKRSPLKSKSFSFRRPDLHSSPTASPPCITSNRKFLSNSAVIERIGKQREEVLANLVVNNNNLYDSPTTEHYSSSMHRTPRRDYTPCSDTLFVVTSPSATVPFQFRTPTKQPCSGHPYLLNHTIPTHKERKLCHKTPPPSGSGSPMMMGCMYKLVIPGIGNRGPSPQPQCHWSCSSPLISYLKGNITDASEHAFDEKSRANQTVLEGSPTVPVQLTHPDKRLPPTMFHRTQRTIQQRAYNVSSSDEPDDASGDLDSPRPCSTDRQHYDGEKIEVNSGSPQGSRNTLGSRALASELESNRRTPRVNRSTSSRSVRAASTRDLQIVAKQDVLQQEQCLQRSGSAPRKLIAFQREGSSHLQLPTAMSDCSSSIAHTALGLSGASSHVSHDDTDCNIYNHIEDNWKRAGGSIRIESQFPKPQLIGIRSFPRVRGKRRSKVEARSLRSSLTSPSTGRSLQPGLVTSPCGLVDNQATSINIANQSLSDHIRLNLSSMSSQNSTSLTSLNSFNANPTPSCDSTIISIISEDSKHAQWLSRPSLLPGEPIRSLPLPRKPPHQVPHEALPPTQPPSPSDTRVTERRCTGCCEYSSGRGVRGRNTRKRIGS